MPAAPAGTTIMTLTDGTGAVALQATIKYNPSTGAFDVNPAIQVTNNTGVTQSVAVTDSGGTTHPFTIGKNGASVTPAQLSAVGVTNNSQLNGISVSLL